MLCITTKYQPKLIDTTNARNAPKIKPIEISEYNKYMSRVDRCDQLISYYSCPRKTIRWYKKVIFHLLDLTVMNSHKLYCIVNKSKMGFLQFREELIRDLIRLPKIVKSGIDLVNIRHSEEQTKNTTEREVPNTLAHYLENIPIPEGYKRPKYYLRCKQCATKKKRSNTSWRCNKCPSKPALCAGKCFEEYHTTK